MNATIKQSRIDKPIRFYSVDDIRRDAEHNFNSHWFTPGAMRFFNSRVSGKTYTIRYLTLFVSSERCDWADNLPRLYSIRSYDSLTGQIETVGEFQQYSSSKAAHRAAQQIVNGEIPFPTKE